MAQSETHTEKLTQLIQNYLEVVPDTVGIVVSQNGGIIHSQIQLDPANMDQAKVAVVNKETVAQIADFIKPLLEKIREQFSTQKFGTAVFETDLYRLLNIAVDPWIFTFALTQMASLDEIYPYAYLGVEKMCRIYEDRRVHLSIPKLGNISGTQLVPTYQDHENIWNFKYILIGNSGVGKTSLVSQFVEGKTKSDFRPTIGLNVMTHKYRFNAYEFRLSIYDVGSQKLFQRVRRTYYAGSNAALIVFDLNDPASFTAIETWKNEMDKFIGRNIPFCLVGNKSDLERKITFEEGTKLAEKFGGSYIETSALEARNVEDAFALLAYKIISEYINNK
jgi:small GTP-binding protein